MRDKKALTQTNKRMKKRTDDQTKKRTNEKTNKQNTADDQNTLSGSSILALKTTEGLFYPKDLV